MLGPAVEDAIEGIAADRTSSASRLARSPSRQSPSSRLKPGLEEESGRTERSGPAHLRRTAGDGNRPQCRVPLRTPGGRGAGTDGCLAELHAELESARERIARTFLKVAVPQGTYVTLSYSDNVLESLKAAHERASVARVYVMESGPCLEGRALAKALAASDIPSTIVPDSEGPSRVREASAVLVGADSILRDGSLINKAGTSSLALAGLGA